MYQYTYIGMKEAQALLGLGRCTLLRLCTERPGGFPVVKVGNRYQFDQDKLAAWRDRWYAGEFEI